MEQTERRLSRRLFSKWQEARGGHGLPALTEVEIEANADPELRNNSFVIDVTPGPAGYRFRRFGNALRQIAGADFTGYQVASLPASIADDALDVFRSAVAAAKPISREEEQVELFGQSLCYRLMVLPVGGRSRRVDALVGTVGYRVRHTNGAGWNRLGGLAA